MKVEFLTKVKRSNGKLVGFFRKMQVDPKTLKVVSISGEKRRELK